MKILHLEASPGWGGQEIRILKESLGMRKKGHEVILCTEKKAHLASFARKEGFTVYELNFRKTCWFFSFIRLLKIIKKHKIDLINTHSSLDAWLGGFVGRFCKVKILRTRHLSTYIKKGWNSKVLYHYLTDSIVTTCEKTALALSKISKKPTKSIPTGINPQEITFSQEEVMAFRKKIGTSNKELLVGMVCFMRSWKGVHDFLQAAHLLKDDKTIKWVIIGGGHEEEYREKARLLQLDNLTFTGHIQKPFAAIQALDVFALLSTNHEGVSQASLQAAFLEKPLITTRIGGLNEVCLDKKTGFLVNCFSPQEVVDKVLILKKSPRLRKQMGQFAKKLVLESFTHEKMLKDMEKIYDPIKKFTENKINLTMSE